MSRRFEGGTKQMSRRKQRAAARTLREAYINRYMEELGYKIMYGESTAGMSRRKQRAAAKTLGDVYLHRYADALDRKLVSLGHTPGPGELWQAHRVAATLAGNEVRSLMPDWPSEWITMNEGLAVENMLEWLGVDEQAFFRHMINASVMAANSGDMNLTTPFGLVVMGYAANDS